MFAPSPALNSISRFREIVVFLPLNKNQLKCMTKLNFIQSRLILFMKISVTQLLMMAAFVSLVSAGNIRGQEVMDRKVSINVENKEIGKILSLIESQAMVHFTYRNKAFETNRKISIQVDSLRLAEVLYRLFDKQLEIVVKDNSILLKPAVGKENEEVIPLVTNSIDFIVSGTVVDETNQSLPGVNVIVKGTTGGTVTDVNGKFSLTAPDEDAILVFSFIGYDNQEVSIKGRTTINITLQPNITSLDEVVVVGYGTQTKKELTSSVATVKGDDIKASGAVSFDNAMQGRVAGVQITQGSGQPGGALTVRVRGASSISGGNNPLYVIDGIPVSAVTNDQIVDGGTGSNPLALLNPSDIESIDVLKDAAATAIYGTRGANGVIIVTTKRGKSGAPKVEFGYYTGWQTVTKKLDQINARQFKEYAIEAHVNAGLTNYTQWPLPVTDSLNTFYSNDFYWQDALFTDNAPISNYDLSVGGGNDKINYYLSGNLLDQNGILANTDFTRLSIRSNVDYNVSNNVKFGNSFTFSNSQSNRTSEDNRGGERGVFFRTANRNPTESPFLPDGSLAPNTPINTLFNAFQSVKNTRVLGNIYGEFKFLKNFSFRTSLGIDFSANLEEQFYPSTIFSFQNFQRTGQAGSSQNFLWINENFLTYTKKFNEAHNFKALLGASAQSQTSNSLVLRAEGFPSDLVRTLNAGPIKTQASTFENEEAIVSFFGRFFYDFKSKYLIAFTARYDGSSKFGKDNRYGFFPSGSIGWLVSEEGFMKDISFINELKIRASAGTVGNDRIPNYVQGGIYNTGANYDGAGGIAPAGNGLPNSALGWEKSNQINAGIDLAVLSGRVKITADVYQKTTENLLFSSNLPSTSGFGSVFLNLGEIQNKGLELGLSTVNLEGQLNWTTEFNISFNQNEVVSLPEGQDQLGGVGILREGNPIGSFYLFNHLRVFPTSEDNVNQVRNGSITGPIFQGGDTEFEDVDGDGFISGTDRVIMGNADPKMWGGFRNRFTYKGFDLDVFFNFTYGQDIYNRLKRDRDSFRLLGGSGGTLELLDRWQNPGDITRHPRPIRGDARGNLRESSSFWLEDGSFLRLKTVSLGYTLPKSLTEKVRMSSARLYVTGQNLLTFTDYTGYDPEVVGTSSNANGFNIGYGQDFGYYPLARTILVGVNLSF